jgi:ribulose-5-phosphate 4-epimerase/fuculose-1-phosphate aldolase
MNDAPVPAGFEELIIRYGSDFSLTQGLGGNCSVKTGDRMKVKASGKRMSAIRDTDFFYEVSLTESGFRDDLEGQIGKPSFEVYLHALLPFKYVVHLHSTRAIAFSMSSRFLSETSLGARSGRIHLLPYTRPGLELMKSLRGLDFVADGFSSILQNHGVVVAANSLSRLANLLEEIENSASPEEEIATGNLSPKLPNTPISPELREHALWHAENNWRATPDHVVFLGSTTDLGVIDALSSSSSVETLFENLSIHGMSNTQQEQVLWFLTLANLLPKEPLNVLSESEVEHLRGWEAEKLRVSKSH